MSVTTEFPPLADVRREHVSTEQAAFYLGLRPQTLFKWAAFEPAHAVVLPVRVGRRLMWPVAKLRLALGAAA